MHIYFNYQVFFITKMVGRWFGFLFFYFSFPIGEAGGQRGGRDEGLPAVRDHQAAEPGLHPRDQCPHLHHRLHRHHERTGEPVAGQSYPDREAGAVLFLKQNLILVKLFQVFFFQGLFLQHHWQLAHTIFRPRMHLRANAKCFYFYVSLERQQLQTISPVPCSAPHFLLPATTNCVTV